MTIRIECSFVAVSTLRFESEQHSGIMVDLSLASSYVPNQDEYLLRFCLMKEVNASSG